MSNNIQVYCSVDFFNKLVNHPLIKVRYAFVLASKVFPKSKVRVYATKKGSKQVFKVTNLDSGETVYVSRKVKITNRIEFCQIFENEEL